MVFLIIFLGIILIIAIINLVILCIPGLYLRIYCREAYKVYKYVLKNIHEGIIISQELDFIQIKYSNYMVYIFPYSNGVGIANKSGKMIFTDFHRKQADRLTRKIYEHFGIN